MQRTAVLEHLSAIHALALPLDAPGADQELIGACLGIAPETVGPLLEMAAAKLAPARQELGAGIGPEGGPGIDERASDAPTPEEATSGYPRVCTLQAPKRREVLGITICRLGDPAILSSEDKKPLVPTEGAIR